MSEIHPGKNATLLNLNFDRKILMLVSKLCYNCMSGSFHLPKKINVKARHDRAGSSRAKPNIFIRDIDYTSNNEHFLPHTPNQKHQQ